MATRREALVKAGLAKPGRGKFSKDAVQWLDNQRKAGVKFSDDDAPVRTPRVITKGEKVEKATPVTDTAYLFPDEYRFPEGEYRAFIRVNGKKKEVSLRECCNVCRVSLVNHACNAPTVHGNIAVTIERR